jgi:hypothetical protein
VNDHTGVSISTTGLDIRPGDPLHQVCTYNGPAIVVRYDGFTITYRAWRWYDGPRLWLRALPDRMRAFIVRLFVRATS